MSFIPSRARLVPGLGRGTEKIVIIGDYTSPFDDKELKPFSGPAGSVLESCLHAAGLIRGDIYLTNVFKAKTKYSYKQANSEFFDEGKKKFTSLGMEHVEMLRVELDKLDANVIVPAGNAAIQAISSLTSVAKYRGYVCVADKLKGCRKMIPTHSPASTLRGSYVNRHMITADLQKARLESEFPEIRRPDRKLIYEFASCEEVLEWLDYLASVDTIAFDIEVINYEVSCVSFAPSPEVSVCVPIGATEYRPNGWTEDEELLIWKAIQRILGNPETTKIVQNGIFDIHFLLTRCGVVVRGPIHDTMIGHSVMFPELPKGLDFLGSVYCGSQAYWKDSVKFNNIKGDS